jgi:hypothetical protein
VVCRARRHRRLPAHAKSQVHRHPPHQVHR